MSELWAKSPRPGQQAGERLTAHSAATLRRVGTVAERIGALPDAPARFWAWARLAGLMHDAGKCHRGHQRQLGNSREMAQPWGERHEVLSLGFLPTVLHGLPKEEVQWVAAGVATHHRQLTGTSGRRPPLGPLYGKDQADQFTARFGDMDPDLAQELARWLHTTATRHRLVPHGQLPTAEPSLLARDARTLLSDLLDRWEWELSPEEEQEGLTGVLLQGAVTMADRMASARTPVHTRHPLTAGYRQQLDARLGRHGHRLRPHQEQAAETSGHVLIRSWTGSGKTEAALLWALRNLQQMQAAGAGQPRVFYLLPYLAAINTMVLRLEKDLQAPGEIGVSHSHAASYYLSRAVTADCDESEKVSAARQALHKENATRLFRELVRVGTPYQPLQGVIAGPSHSSVLLDTANSLFILDELHAYDPRRLGIILAMVSFWERIGGRFAVVSATLPDALQDAIRAALQQQVQLVEPPEGTRFPRRHRLVTHREPLTAEASIAEMTRRITDGQALLVVANNRRTARALYQQLGPIARAHHNHPAAALLLHSRYRRDDRASIEDRIRTRYQNGRDDRSGGLLVATQTVEVSLDVDFDAIHTACAPMDALCQRFGRVNRSGTRPPADVVVHTPTYLRRGGSSELFADGVYPQDPVELAWNILQRHHGTIIDESIITGWLNEIYTPTGSWGAHWRNQVEVARARFTEAFLTWTEPFRDRSDIRQALEDAFDGKEAICLQHRDEYAQLLETDDGRRAGRLLAEDLLIPIPGTTPTTWDESLKVHLINAHYHPETGLDQPR